MHFVKSQFPRVITLVSTLSILSRRNFDFPRDITLVPITKKKKKGTSETLIQLLWVLFPYEVFLLYGKLFSSYKSQPLVNQKIWKVILIHKLRMRENGMNRR